MAFGVAAQSLASARIDALATDPRLVEDYDLIWLYPNKVLEYKNTVDFRLNEGPFSTGYPNNGAFGGGNDEWGGLLIEEETIGGVLGIYVNRPNRLYTAAHRTNTNYGTLSGYYWYYAGGAMANGATAPWNILDVFYGTALDGADLGVHVNYGDNGIGGREVSVIGLDLGLGFKDFGPFNEANIHASYSMLDWTDVGSAAPNADNGIFDIKAGGLIAADMGNDATLRLSADVLYNSTNEEDFYGDSSTGLNVLVGLGCNHKVNGGKAVVSHGLMIDWASLNYDDGTSYAANRWTILWNANVEAPVTNWLTLRAGIIKALLAREYNEPGFGGAVYADADDNAVAFTAGMGITWQNFTIDGVINVSSLESWLSGPNAGAGIFYPGVNGGDGQGIVALSEIDVKYKF
jgi:hypothetical protein